MSSFNPTSFILGVVTSTVVSVGTVMAIAHYSPSMFTMNNDIPPVAVVDPNIAMIRIGELPAVGRNPDYAQALFEHALKDFSSVGTVIIDKRAVLASSDMAQIQLDSLASYVETLVGVVPPPSTPRVGFHPMQQPTPSLQFTDSEMKAAQNLTTEEDLQKTAQALTKLADYLEGLQKQQQER